jgi:hypothetical protein
MRTHIAIVAVVIACSQAEAQGVAPSCPPVASRPAFSDGQLLQRFPDKATYERRRYAALEPGRKAVRESQERLESLRRQRSDFNATLEPSPNRSLPDALQRDIDARDAAIAAQEALVREQQCHLEYLTESYDRAAVRLGPLWAAKAP